MSDNQKLWWLAVTFSLLSCCLMGLSANAQSGSIGSLRTKGGGIVVNSRDGKQSTIPIATVWISYSPEPSMITYSAQACKFREDGPDLLINCSWGGISAVSSTIIIDLPEGYSADPELIPGCCGQAGASGFVGMTSATETSGES